MAEVPNDEGDGETGDGDEGDSERDVLLLTGGRLRRQVPAGERD